MRHVIDLFLERHDGPGQAEDDDEDGAGERANQVQLEERFSDGHQDQWRWARAHASQYRGRSAPGASATARSSAGTAAAKSARRAYPSPRWIHASAERWSRATALNSMGRSASNAPNRTRRPWVCTRLDSRQTGAGRQLRYIRALEMTPATSSCISTE